VKLKLGKYSSSQMGLNVTVYKHVYQINVAQNRQQSWVMKMVLYTEVP